VSNKTLPSPLNFNRSYLFAKIITVVSYYCSYINKSDSVNRYVLYALPLITFTALYPFVLKKDVEKVIYTIKKTEEYCFQNNELQIELFNFKRIITKCKN